jgi:hypothetical protein
LERAAVALLEHPELASLGPPRSGERPSNALLGDADYRAAWRAWRLFRRLEDMFRLKWTNLDRLWAETCLFAAWAAMDADDSFEAIPQWLQGLDRGEDGIAVRCGGPRTWVAASGPFAHVVRIGLGGDGIEVREVLADIAGAAERSTHVIDVALSLDAGPDWLQRARHLVLSHLPAKGSGHRQPSTTLPARVGLSLLNATGHACDERGVRAFGPVAAAVLRPAKDELLTVCDRAATWLPDVEGPAELFTRSLRRAGQVVSRHAGIRDTAVVVPDALDDLALAELRATSGRVWTVWSPVAAMLAAVADHRAEVEDAMRDAAHVLVVVATDVALDVAVLERSSEPESSTDKTLGERQFWIRSEPMRTERMGTAPRFEESDAGVRGAWLRHPAGCSGWALADDFPDVVRWSGGDAVTAARVRESLSQWRGPPPALAVVVGVEPAVVGQLGQWPVLGLDQAALARGAWVFLDRKDRGLPTWKDRLPEVALRIRENLLRVDMPLIERGKLVSPGETLNIQPERQLVIPAGAQSVRFDVTREGQQARYAFAAEGPPLPLGQPCAVRMRLDFCYGVEGMRAWLVPEGRQAFERLPLHLRSAGDASSGPVLPVGPPPTWARELVADAAGREIKRAFAHVRDAWKALPEKDRRDAQRNPEAFERLRPQVKELAVSLKLLNAEGTEHQDPMGRWMLDELAPWLDWLLGLSGRGGSGPAPKLGKSAAIEVARCRAAVGLQGSGAFVRWLFGKDCPLPPADRLAAVGRVIEGDAATWRRLVEWDLGSPALRQPWAEAVGIALRARPDLAAADIDLTHKVLNACMSFLAAMVEEGSAHRDASRKTVYALLAPIPWLCAARSTGALQPHEEVVRDAIERLSGFRAQLPESVRSFGERTSIQQDDEPIGVAIAYLAGDYGQLPTQRSR